MTKVGFIGLGNVGAKLAATLQRNQVDLWVHDIDPAQAAPFLAQGAAWADSPAEMARQVDVVMTCLPSPKASATVMEADNGILQGLSAGKIWIEMSTTDEAEVRRLAVLVEALGAQAADCPVSGGCHRAATGNIAILAGCERNTFDAILPILSILGREILHVGALGSASTIKVVTNYLATANLVSLCEALTVSKAAGLDLGLAPMKPLESPQATPSFMKPRVRLSLTAAETLTLRWTWCSKTWVCFRKLPSVMVLNLSSRPCCWTSFATVRRNTVLGNGRPILSGGWKMHRVWPF